MTEITCPLCEKQVNGAPGAYHICPDIKPYTSLRVRKALRLIYLAVATVCGLTLLAALSMWFVPPPASVTVSLLGGMLIGGASVTTAICIITE